MTLELWLAGSPHTSSPGTVLRVSQRGSGWTLLSCEGCLGKHLFLCSSEPLWEFHDLAALRLRLALAGYRLEPLPSSRAALGPLARGSLQHGPLFHEAHGKRLWSRLLARGSCGESVSLHLPEVFWFDWVHLWFRPSQSLFGGRIWPWLLAHGGTVTPLDFSIHHAVWMWARCHLQRLRILKITQSCFLSVWRFAHQFSCHPQFPVSSQKETGDACSALLGIP